MCGKHWTPRQRAARGGGVVVDGARGAEMRGPAAVCGNEGVDACALVSGTREPFFNTQKRVLNTSLHSSALLSMQVRGHAQGKRGCGFRKACGYSQSGRGVVRDWWEGAVESMDGTWPVHSDCVYQTARAVWCVPPTIQCVPPALRCTPRWLHRTRRWTSWRRRPPTAVRRGTRPGPGGGPRGAARGAGGIRR